MAGNTSVRFPDRMFVDGDSVFASDRHRTPCFDPSTGESVGGAPRGSAADVDRAVDAATRAFYGEWRRWSPHDRAVVLLRLATTIDEHRDEIAALDTINMGRPYDRTLDDIRMAAEVFRYNAGAADKLEGTSVPISSEFVDFTELVPLGPTAHIVPWNFPFGMAVRSVAPALAAGCTVVLKPAEQTPFSAIRLAELAHEDGLPSGVLNVVTGMGAEAGAALVGHHGIRGISFTGSRATGQLIMQTAAGRVTPLVLELGGKNSLVVFPDANLPDAISQSVEAAFDNTGQVCSAASRILLHDAIANEFIDRFAERCDGLTIGGAMQSPDLGPLAHASHFEKVSGYVDRAKKAHRLLYERAVHDMPDHGWFSPPAVFEVEDYSSELWRDEVFGPVVAVARFSNEKEALRLANDTEYGLVAGVFTSDVSRAYRFARSLETGSVWINGWSLGGFQAPTGGIKQSGFGKERGMAGLSHYTSIRNVAVRLVESIDDAEKE